MSDDLATVHVDYLIIGAGAMGMAFADVVMHESDATIAIVDERPAPGGHWNDAYGHVRLHQPSAFYGVNSRVLGSDTIDTDGFNAGLYELASGAEVVDYYNQIMQQDFLPSGRVQYFPGHRFDGDTADRLDATSLDGEGAVRFDAERIVDATYMDVTIPATTPPGYDVADDVICVPPNALSSVDAAGQDYVVIGGGKTAMDACLRLLEQGVAADSITWIRPRDSWCLNRRFIQPGEEFAETSMGAFNTQLEVAAVATGLEDLFLRLEAAGQLLRLDRTVQPTMYRCATVTESEIEALRSITTVVRLGRVRQITSSEIVLDEGTVSTSPTTIHVDCTADGLANRPAVPIFGPDKITLQAVRTCQQVFSAAFIAHVELAYSADGRKNELARVIPHPDIDTDWLRVTVANGMNSAVWREDEELTAWLQSARLDAFSDLRQARTEAAGPAVANLMGMLDALA